jgi:LuxR family transcriptional regulator, maltose regulon positive regulatory protein
MYTRHKDKNNGGSEKVLAGLPGDRTHTPSKGSRLRHGLISTKLHSPPLKPRMLYRSHLLDRLTQGKDHPLIVISSTAGSGKTSLISQWIEREKLSAAWYSIDDIDNESDIFFRYFLAALAGVNDELSSAARPWLTKQERLGAGEIFPLIIDHLITLNKDIYLVLDDYHLITSGEIHDGLSYFLDHMPPAVHVIIITRYAVPFSVSRFRLRNQITEICAADMSLSEEETGRFFSETMRIDLPLDQVQELARYTEGWIGGLQLLGLTLHTDSALKGLSLFSNKASRESVAGYLIEEVVNAQPENIRSFLYATVFLDRFSTDLCREVTGQPDVQGILAHMRHHNLFLIPLDAEKIWYRYHQIFTDALRDLVRATTPDIVKEVHRKAALWFARNHHLEDAFQHAFGAEDFEFAADLMEDYWDLFYDRYNITFYLRWIAKLPRETLMRRPLLRLHDCSVNIESVQLSDIEAVLEDIEGHKARALEQYQGVKRTLCRDMLAYLKCVLPYYRDQVRANTHQLDQLMHRSSPGDKFLSGITKVTMARCHVLQGNLITAAETLKEASEAVLSSENTYVRMLWTKVMSDVERWQGHLHRAEAVLGDSLVFMQQKGLSDSPMQLMYYLPMAWLFYYRNDLEKALEYGIIAVRNAEKGKATAFVVEGNIVLSFVYAALNDVENADRCAQRLHEVSRSTGNPNTIISVDACVVYPHIARANLGWLEQRLGRRDSDSDPPFSFTLVHDKLARAGLLHRQGRYKEAAHDLASFREFCVDRNLMFAVMDIDLMNSANLYALGDYKQAEAVMEQALVFSEVEWYIRPFATYAPMIAPILLKTAKFLSGTRESSHMTTIFRVCGLESQSAIALKGSQVSHSGGLTRRESEILKLMAAGYRNGEIAEKIFVSLDTVKAHAKHIFEKLGTKTRVQAIRQAEELHLLDSN